jgi:hypothetical protein
MMSGARRVGWVSALARLSAGARVCGCASASVLAAQVALVVALACVSGCTFTVVGDQPAAIAPLQPVVRPTIEYSVAEFSFALGAGDFAPSIFDGHQLGEEIMEAWVKRGYVQAEPQYVVDGAFTQAAEYRLTVRGSQRGDTGWTMEIINALTLGLVPYTIDQHYKLEFVLEDARSGTSYEADVRATDKTWVEPLLIFALPWANRGHRATMQRVGDELYAQFRRQGAFAAPVATVATPTPVPPES